MKRVLLLLALIVSACSTHPPSAAIAPSYISDGSYGNILESQIAAIERSDPAAWHQFRIGNDTRGAHTSETFSAGCAYLVRRDPTFFLRRHMEGDRYALPCGRRAYQWSGDYRQVLDSVYKFRLLEAKSPSEKERIEQFITETKRQP